MKNYLKKENSNFDNNFKFSLTNFLNENKYPIIITIGFFLVFGFISFNYHNYFFEGDAIFFLNWGQQILEGSGKNVKVTDAQIGGPVFYAYVNSFIHDGFLTLKLISLFSGTGIVFLSYYIIRNIFNFKIAIVGQLFFAFTSQLGLQSVLSFNELLFLFLIFCSMYFITKKNLNVYDIILVGSFLGLSSMIRFQALLVFLPFLIYLFIHDKKIRIKLKHVILFALFFLVTSAPVYIYNYSVHDTLAGTDLAYYLAVQSVFYTPEWKEKLMQMHFEEAHSTLSIIFVDFNLFLKNYFYNLFYHNPDNLFNFNKWSSLSIIPLVPYLGVVPVLGGLIHVLKIGLNKRNIILLSGISLITTFFVFLFGEIDIHFFAIIIIPLLSLGIVNIRKIEKNLLPLLILSVVYFLIISVAALSRSVQLFSIWIIIAILSSVFFVEVIPGIYFKIKSVKKPKSHPKSLSVFIIIMVLLMNLGFTYKIIDFWLYEQETKSCDQPCKPSFEIQEEFLKFFQTNEPRVERGFEAKEIGDILSRQSGIEESYVMASNPNYSYYANSKYVMALFREGIKNDSFDNYISRENWSDADIYYSNFVSNPTDRQNINNPIPDYLVYSPFEKTYREDPSFYNITQAADLQILSDPQNPGIPENFEVLYKSNRTELVAYKINH